MKVSGRSGKAAPSPPPAPGTAVKAPKSTAKSRQLNENKSATRQAAVSHAAKAAATTPAHNLDDASLANFTRWNETAMEALRAGDGATSRRILTSLLPELRERLALATKAASSKGRAAPDAAATVVLQSWQLVYALTLNNYGCQLRRDGQSDAALQQFLTARDVETAVFGKPSCSTMLNLSAVLLSRGEAKAALAIATECAAAAQDGEPVLFITALHNLAVALGQQSGERSRSAALPTMLQALREAQAALGESHPTTKMLKEKCGLTSQWIHPTPPTATLPQPESVVTAPGGQKSYAPQPHSPALAAPSVSFSSASNRDESTQAAGSEQEMSPQERARAALYTLNFGAPPKAHQSARRVEAQVKDTADSKGSDDGRRATPLQDYHTQQSPSPDSWERLSEKSSGSKASPTRLPPLGNPSKVGGARLSSGNTPFTHHPSGAASAEDRVHRDSNAAVSVDQLCLDSAHLSTVEFGTPTEGPETVLQEAFHPSALSLNRHGATTLRDLCGVNQNGSVVYPSFLRFSAELPPVPSRTASANAKASMGNDKPSAAAATTTNGRLPQDAFFATDAVPMSNGDVFAQTTPADMKLPKRARTGSAGSQQFSNAKGGKSSTSLFATAPAAVSPKDAHSVAATSSARPSSPAKDNSHPHNHLNNNSSNNNSSSTSRNTQPAAARRTLFGHSTAHPNGGSASSGRWADRAAQRQADLAEEEAYRRKLKEAEAAEEAAHAFERGLAKVKARTQARAARVIQRAWQQWWTSVGQPRRHVQLQRLEELQRRRRDRLALSSATGKRVPSAKLRTAPAGTSGSPLSSTPLPHGRVGGQVMPAVVVRCGRRWLAKTACVRCAARLTRARVDGRLCEADVYRRVCKLQALWRGALQRQRLQVRDEQRGTSVEGQRAEDEMRAYAALVVQCAFRRHAARRARQRLYAARYDAPATTIQQWLRRTWADQQQRGVDAPTSRRRNAAATDIQRVWRGYQGRVAFRMRELRQRIDQATPYALAIEGGETAAPAMAPSSVAKSSKTTEVPFTHGPTSTPPQGPVSAPTASPSVPSHPPEKAAAANAAYEAACLQRGSAVQDLRDAEREHFHIPLYVETMASKERAAWQAAVRLRPTDVVRRRAELNSTMEAEQTFFVRHRAARVIQRAFRAWRAMLQDAARDTGLLRYARMRYQQRELGAAVAQQQRARDVDRAVRLYGDTIAPVREERARAAVALAAAEGEPEVVATPRAAAAGAMVTAPELALMSTVGQPCEQTSRARWRREQEALLHRDERLLALTAPHNAAHLREGPEECEARLGTTYEHPYYTPYVNEEHRWTLGID